MKPFNIEKLIKKENAKVNPESITQKVIKKFTFIFQIDYKNIIPKEIENNTNKNEKEERYNK